MFQLLRTRVSGATPRLCRAFGGSAGEKKKAVIVGGCGSLGDAVTRRFSEEGWSCLSIDFKSNENPSTSSIVLSTPSSFSSPPISWSAEVERVREECKSKGFQGVDAVIHAGGSWAGGNVNDMDFPSSLDHLWHANVQSAALSAHLAGACLKNGGFFSLTGALAATNSLGTPGMTAYGMTKAATHQLLDTVSQKDGGLPCDSLAVAILPITIDSAGNRAAMPDADKSSWTNPRDIAERLLAWANRDPSTALPRNGDKIKIETADNKTKFSTI